jgi:hypothetical protein
MINPFQRPDGFLIVRHGRKLSRRDNIELRRIWHESYADQRPEMVALKSGIELDYDCPPVAHYVISQPLFASCKSFRIDRKASPIAQFQYSV